MDFYENKIMSVEDLIPYALNTRTHSDDQVAQIAASIRAFGFTNPVLIDEQNNLIAGHGRVMAARKLKMTEVPAVVVTGLDDRKRRALIIADNKLALNAGWDEDALRIELEDLGADFGALMGFSQDELVALLKSDTDEDNEYTKKVSAPVYEPTGPKPELEEMFNDEKTRDLLYGIEGSGLSDEEKRFLTLAAGRHTVFNFEVIANYYAHASKECQELMEDSALVIIDFEKAIENGYVKMSDKLSEIYLSEYADDEE
jgi:ParB-like nuclease domain